MKTTVHVLVVALVLALPAAVFAQADGGAAPAETTAQASGPEAVTSLLAAQPNLTEFGKFFTDTYKESTLPGSAEGVTIFAPIDGTNPAAAGSALDYLVAGKLSLEDLFLKTELTALSGKKLGVRYEGDRVFIEGVPLAEGQPSSSGAISLYRLSGTFAASQAGN